MIEKLPVIDDHVVELDVRIILGHSFSHVEEKSVCDFHYVLKLEIIIHRLVRL